MCFYQAHFCQNIPNLSWIILLFIAKNRDNRAFHDHEMWWAGGSGIDVFCIVNTWRLFRYRDRLSKYGFFIIKIRRSIDRCIFITRIPILAYIFQFNHPYHFNVTGYYKGQHIFMFLQNNSAQYVQRFNEARFRNEYISSSKLHEKYTIMDVITYPCWDDWNYSAFVKGPLGSNSCTLYCEWINYFPDSGCGYGNVARFPPL